jgi:hypothetical protein
MWLAAHVTPNFNHNMSTAVVFLDIEKAFDTTWHSGLLCKLSQLECSTSLIRLIASFLTDRKFKALVEIKISARRKNNGRNISRFYPCPSIEQSIHNWRPRGTWNPSHSVRGRYLYLRDRETPTSCSLQTASRPHCSEVMLWTLKYEGQWMEESDDLCISPEDFESLTTNYNYMDETFRL